MKKYLVIYDIEGDVCVVQAMLSDQDYSALLDHCAVYKMIPLNLISYLPSADASFLHELKEDL